MNNARIQRAKKAALHTLASNLQLQQGHSVILRDILNNSNGRVLAAYKSGEFNALTQNVRNRDLGFTNVKDGMTIVSIEGEQPVNLVKLIGIVTKIGMIHDDRFKTLSCTFTSSNNFTALVSFVGNLPIVFSEKGKYLDKQHHQNNKQNEEASKKFPLRFARFIIKDTQIDKKITLQVSSNGQTTISAISGHNEVRDFFSKAYLRVPGDNVERAISLSFDMIGYTPDLYTISQALAHAKFEGANVTTAYENKKHRVVTKKKAIPEQVLFVHIGKDILFKLMMNSFNVQILEYEDKQAAVGKVKRLLQQLLRNGFLLRKAGNSPANSSGNSSAKTPPGRLTKNRKLALTANKKRRPNPPDEFTGTCPDPKKQFIMPDEHGFPCCYSISRANPKKVKKKYAKLKIPIPQSVKDALDLTNSPASSSVNTNNNSAGNKLVLSMSGPNLVIGRAMAKYMTKQNLLLFARRMRIPEISNEMTKEAIIAMMTQFKNANAANNGNARVKRMMQNNANRNAALREKKKEKRNRQESANAKKAIINAKAADDARMYRPGVGVVAAASSQNLRNAAAERTRIAAEKRKANNAANQKAEENRYRINSGLPTVNRRTLKPEWKNTAPRRKKTFNANAFPAQRQKTPPRKNNSSPNSDRRSSYSGTTSETKAGPSLVKKVVRKRQKTMATEANIQRMMVTAQALVRRRNRQGNTKNNAIVINSSPNSETRRRRKPKGKGPKVNSSSSNNV